MKKLVHENPATTIYHHDIADGIKVIEQRDHTGQVTYTLRSHHFGKWRTQNPIVEVVETFSVCPGCYKKEELWAISRYGYGAMCSDCGKKEAFEGDFISDASQSLRDREL